MGWTVKQSFTAPTSERLFRIRAGESVSPADPRITSGIWELAVAEGWVVEDKPKSKPAPANKARKRPSNK